MQLRRDASRRYALLLLLISGIVLCVFWFDRHPLAWVEQTASHSIQPLCDDLTDPSCCLTGRAWSHLEVQHELPTWPWLRYKSSDITPPKFEIGGNGGALAPGYLFFAQYGPEARQDALLIMTTDNDLVYGLPIDLATNVHVAEYRSAQYLVFWSGYGIERQANGHHYGQVNFMDEGYEVAHVVCGELDTVDGLSIPAPCKIDNHEQVVTPRGTVLVATYNVTKADLSSVNGIADGWLMDNVLFELNIATSEIYFQWSAKDHVAFETSHQLMSDGGTFTKPWDFFHINSIQMIGGDYLINGRHTWSTYLVSGYDGHIIWRVEGESGGDFGSLPEEARFRWQHDARAHNITDTSITISWFNNYNAPLYNGTRSSTLLALHFDLPPDRVKTPRVVQTVHYPNDSIYSTSQGSYTRDVAGTQNQLADYGNMPLFREFGPPAEDSDLRWEARFGTEAGSSQTYRVFKGEWHATPKTWDPSLVVERPDDAPGRKCATGHVSWNGATEVEEWNVYMAPDKGSRMEKMVVVDKHGFETAFNIPTRGCVQLGAVQSSKEVRRSNVACL